MRDIRLLISSVLILLSFFLGYIFASVEQSKKYEKEIERIKYIEIKTSKTKVSFKTEEENTIFIIDGKPSESQEILYEKK
jgi:Ca2+/Na+ antiporter